MKTPRCALALLAALLVAAADGGEFDFFAEGPYLPQAPRPDRFLGYEAGALHTHHFRLQEYFEALAAAVPERLQLHSYGESYERKTLFYAVISSAENLRDSERIRTRNLALADPRTTSGGEAEDIIRHGPVIVWLDYGNDGNETAGPEAAMLVAYQLAAGESEEMAGLRERAIIIVDPDHNPESHDRHVAWYNAFGIGDSDPLAMEHHAPWGMSTNNNHYQIDLNRDAWALTQMENQALAAEVLRWRPQVFVDHHGQTENYFFAPPADPIHPSLPDSHRRWYEVMGQGNARAFDRYGWQYYVRDVFDLYYPGYWDSWPALQGAIAMTYETDGGGSRGLAWQKPDGSVVTFRDGIAKHFVASLATLRTSVEHRESLLRDYLAFFASALAEGRQGSPARAFALQAEPDPRRTAVLVGTLLRHGVEVQRVEEAFTASAEAIEGSGSRSVTFAAGTYLVDLAQPGKRLAETLIVADPPLDPEFIRRQFGIWSRNARRGAGSVRERHEFYDLTAWSLPIAFGVDAYALSELPEASRRAVEPDAGRLVGSGAWEEEIPFDPGTGGGITSRITGPTGTAHPVAGEHAPARSVYLFRPETEGAPRLAAALLREGFRVAVSTEPLTVGSEDLPIGTFLVRVVRNPENMHLRIAELARQAAVDVISSDTAFAAHGSTGAGSSSVRSLRKPRIAMIADEGVSIAEYGAAWFYLEHRLGFPFTPIRIAELMRNGLDRFDVVVCPQTSGVGYPHALGDDNEARFKQWIERGGTVVAWGAGTAAWLISTGLVDSAFAGQGEGIADPGDEEEPTLAEIDRLAPPEGPRQPLTSPTAEPAAPQPIPGAVVRTRLDLTHWLTFGFSDSTLPVLVRGDRFLELSNGGENPVVFASDDELPIGGFLWPDNSQRWLADRAYVTVVRHGRGQVVLFSQDPNYRLVWRATSRLFANALLLAPTLGTETASRY